MKKLFYHLISVIVGLAVMTGCDNHECPEIIPEQTSQGIMKNAIATYQGEDGSYGHFTFDFCSAAFGENGAVPANAYGLHLELYSDKVPAEDLLYANIESGRYTVGKETGDFVILAGNSDTGELEGSYYFTSDASGNITKKELVAGEVFFVITEEYKAAFISNVQYDEQENKWISYEYNGQLEIEPVYDMIYTSQRGWYWGDDTWDFPGIGQYMVTLIEGETDIYGDLAEGYAISLSYYGEMTPTPWEAKIPEGTYLASTSYDMNKILVATPNVIENERWRIWGYTMHQHVSDGVDNRYFVTDGMSKVSRQGDQDVLKFNLLLENGERYLAKYTGSVRQGDEYTRTSLTQDLTVGSLDYGYLEYEGPSPMANVHGVNRWTIRLYNDGLVVDPTYYWGIYNDGTGEYVIIQIYTDSYYTTDIPVGRYAIVAEEVPFHANTGQGGWGFNWATWYYRFETGASAPAMSGDVNVSKTGSDYTIDIVFKDDRGNTITANYVGPLTYWSSYTPPDPAAPSWVYSPANSYQAAKGARVAGALERHNGK